MARKKKVINVPQDKMLTYRGEVRIELVKNNKTVKTIKVHNEGKEPLFRFLAECLIGQLNDDRIPMFIRLFNASDLSEPNTYFLNETTLTSISRNKAALDTTSTGGTANEQASVVNTFIIPAAVVQENSTSNIIAIYDRLHSGERTSPSAFIKLEGDNVITANGMDNIKVVWKMTIGNK